MNGNGRIYWHYDKQLEMQNAKLAAEPHTLKNRELLKAFQQSLLTNGITQARVAKLMWGLRRVSLALKKDLDKVNKRDLAAVLGDILTETNDRTGKLLSENTKRDYKRCVKQFYRWLGYQEEYEADQELLRVLRYLSREVKTPDPKAKHDPGNCLTPEDISKVMDVGCQNEQERALLSVLFETGARIGELLNVRLCDLIDRDKDGNAVDVWSLRVDGKTGERIIPLLQSIPFLTRWLAFHPDRQNPNAFLWMQWTRTKYVTQMSYPAARETIRRCFARAGVKKKHNPHWWRHSRCTIDAADPSYTDTLLCNKMGHGPKVAMRYRHLNSEQLKDAVRRSAGIQVREDNKKRPLLPQQCKTCLEVNPHNAAYCAKCGRPLSMDVVLLEQQKLREAFEKQAVIMASEVLRKEFEEFKKELGGAQ